MNFPARRKPIPLAATMLAVNLAPLLSLVIVTYVPALALFLPNLRR